MERTLPKVREVSMAPHAQTVDQDLDEGAEVCGAQDLPPSDMSDGAL